MNTQSMSITKERKLKVSEIFLSVEGEGPYTGWPMIFVRLFGCNFTCSGFGNTKPELDYSRITDVRQIDKVENGCDSSYSWHNSAKQLTTEYTPSELATKILDVLEEQIGNRSFQYTNGQPIILCFTGGEPMLWQVPVMKTLQALESVKENMLYHILFETNATQKLEPVFEAWLRARSEDLNALNKDIIFSMSPKLSNSGEQWSKAIIPSVASSYATVSNDYYFKFVSNNSSRSWTDIVDAISAFKTDADKVWIMPEAATKEQQDAIAETLALACLKKGYKYCHRTHVSIFGNKTMT